MTRTVTALYDTRSEAESARERLSSTVETCSAKIIDQSSIGPGSESSSESSLDTLYVTEEDREVYGEGVRRGGFMLCAEVSGDEEASTIIEVLEQTAAVDMDQRQQDWQREGWKPASFSSTGSDGSMAQGSAGQTSSRNLGTRQTERGGSRARSYARNGSEGGLTSGSERDGPQG